MGEIIVWYTGVASLNSWLNNHMSMFYVFHQASMEVDGGDQWDIGEADDNTKRFYGM